MTDAQELLRGGDLVAAKEALQQQVRSQPADSKHRVFLFQLLALQGEWDRALTQLNVAGDLDAATLGMVAVYREALGSEALRAQVFAGTRTPLLFAEPERWSALLFEALRVEGQGAYDKAADIRAEAFEQAPASAGTITIASHTDAQPFTWLADADARLGPIVEVIMKGQYYWVPINHIRSISIEPPEDLRDMVWLPAEFVWQNGGDAVGLIPSRYVGSDQSDDPTITLARKTEWLDKGSEVFHGLGQRLLATDQDEYSLLDVRQIELGASADAAPAT